MDYKLGLAAKTWAETMQPNSVGGVMVQMSQQFKERYGAYVSEVELYSIASNEDLGLFTRQLAAYVYVMSKEYNWKHS